MSDKDILSMDNVVKYLEEKSIMKDIVSIKPIREGASGAKIYQVVDKYDSYIVKHSHSSFCLDNNEIYETYLREYDFYIKMLEHDKFRLPKVLHIEKNSKLGIIIVFREYENISNEKWSLDKLEKVVDYCAELHSLDTNILNDLNLSIDKVDIDSDLSSQALSEWKEIMNQNFTDQEIRKLEDVERNISKVCDVLNTGPFNICHGDFHSENVLTCRDEIVVCDWQKVGIGKGVSDISFFISRGKASGLNIDENQIIEQYCDRLSYHKKELIDKKDIYNILHASTVYVSFIHWPYYLKDSSSEKVLDIYNEMINAFDGLNI